MMLDKLGNWMQKNETEVLSHTMWKNKLKQVRNWMQKNETEVLSHTMWKNK